jgi:Zn-dependent peptidase ImmA (M78 family)
MKWISDATGRFRYRPFYSDEELDTECEIFASNLLRSRHGAVQFPLSTDDLTVLIEREAEELELYADLSGEGPAVEGVTEFRAGRKARVLISKHLSETDRYVNCLRTTLAHEWGHVHFHTFLHGGSPSINAKLFGDEGKQPGNQSGCQTVETTPPAYDWMEWQAWYAAGTLLIPKSAVSILVQYLHDFGEDEPEQLFAFISNQFQVSRDEARVRLSRVGLLNPDRSAHDPIDIATIGLRNYALTLISVT